MNVEPWHYIYENIKNETKETEETQKNTESNDWTP